MVYKRMGTRARQAADVTSRPALGVPALQMVGRIARNIRQIRIHDVKSLNGEISLFIGTMNTGADSCDSVPLANCPGLVSTAGRKPFACKYRNCPRISTRLKDDVTA